MAQPHVSLCCILGNETHHIERFLTSFLPVVEEVSLVQALGNRAPDGTEEIARRVCAAADKPLVWSVYRNEPGLDWPHVDNFARARQQSFDQSTGVFCMWADADDILDPTENAPKLKAQLDLGNFDVLFLAYNVPGNPVIMRERVLRRGVGRWICAVHEAYSFPADPAIRRLARHDIEFFHFPLHNGQGKAKTPESISRNVRILEHSVGPSIIAYFYLHRDSLVQGDIAKAKEYGKQALGCSALTLAERYKVMINLAQVYLREHDFANFEQYAMNAVRICPDRREGYCCMAMGEMERQNWGRALTWIRLAQNIELPVQPERFNWLDRDWYSWREVSTEAFIHRKLGHPLEADQAENRIHEGRPVVSLLHATRGRPKRCLETRDHWFSMAQNPMLIEHVFAVDDDDGSTLAATDGFRRVVVPAGGGCVRAWNASAAASRGRLLVQMSDDWDVPYHWDAAIVSRMRAPIMENRPAVLAISDGIRADPLLCIAILTRARYEQQREGPNGKPYLFHQDYLGVFSDNEFTVRAYDDGVTVEAKDIMFQHHHPVGNPEIPLDATYEAQNSPERYAQGLAVFNRRNPKHALKLLS